MSDSFAPLKPCPFCGTADPNFQKDGEPAPTPAVVHDTRSKIRYVECERCGARGPIAVEHESARLLWNGLR